MNLKSLQKITLVQWITFLSAFLGWAMDSFDFFMVSLLLPTLSKEFQVPISVVSTALTVSLLLRPIGAVLFGYLGDRYGRRYPLMLDIFLYSLLSLITGFSQTATQFFIVRSFFGIAMGGEWALGAALLMETLPVETRGFFGGLYQIGYPVGTIFATIISSIVVPKYGWRAMFFVGASPAILIIFLRFFVPESQATKKENTNVWKDVKRAVHGYTTRFIYFTILCTLMHGLSHAVTDMLPTYLEKQRQYSQEEIHTTIQLTFSVGLLGGLIFPTLSQSIGRRNGIMLCGLGVMAAAYPFCFMDSLLAIQISGSFLYSFVNGYWGIMPAHLNELSPMSLRAIFPGLVYNLGNTLSSPIPQLISFIAERCHMIEDGQVVDGYSTAIAIIILSFAFLIVVLAIKGPENMNADLNFEDDIEFDIDHHVQKV